MYTCNPNSFTQKRQKKNQNQNQNMMLSSSKFYTLFFFLLFLSSFASLSAAAAATTSAWDSFLDLAGCQVGDNNTALPILKSYLRRFGYLPQYSGSANNDDNIFDFDLESAIKTYQQTFHLDPTGLLDQPTISQLISPRCGVADVINGTLAASTSGRLLYTYPPHNPTWPPSKRSLTYAFTSTSTISIPISTLRPLFSRAFARWSAVIGITFSEVSLDNSHADITIGFFQGEHGHGQPFDGPAGVLAHAFYPTDGRFHLDADEPWVAEGDVGENGVDLESVAVHEIGHLLGLGHSSDQEAVMFPTVIIGKRKVELAKDDIDGVQNLYGRSQSYKEGLGSIGRDI